MVISKQYCNNCQGHTDHTEIFSKETKWHDEIDGKYTISGTSTCYVYECNGCHTTHMLQVDTNSEWDEVQEERFPQRVTRLMPKWFVDLPDDQIDLLGEIYRAMPRNTPRLVIMGARALYDQFLNDKVGDIGGFEEKAKKAKELGIISEGNAAILKEALEVGHATTHRGYSPSEKVANNVLDIVESLLQTYSLERQKKALAAKTPKRRPKK